MKGLLLKDLYLIRSQGKLAGIVILFYLVWSILSANIYMSSFVFLFAAMLPMSIITYDQYYKWDSYALSAPLTRKDVIRAKYLFCFLMLGMAILAELLAGVLIMLRQPSQDITTMAAVLFVTMSIAVFYISVLIPVNIKLGTEKGRVVMILLLIIPAILGYAYMKSPLPKPDEGSLDAIVQKLPAFAPVAAAAVLVVLLLGLSYVITLNIYKKKEF